MENQNSVVYVGKIGSLSEILGADNIELVTVGGWQAITKKGEYKVDDLVVVATTDAVIPQKLSDDLGVTNYLRKGQRVRTVKLRGVYSEFLIIPIGFVPEKYRYEGADCMELLDIFKFEPPVKTIQLSVGGRKIKYHQNPNFKVYYKFPNQKNVPDMFTEEDEVVITRKLHGTNARYGIVRKKNYLYGTELKCSLEMSGLDSNMFTDPIMLRRVLTHKVFTILMYGKLLQTHTT
jgi:RNA ligase (TIGR02306 family)